MKKPRFPLITLITLITPAYADTPPAGSEFEHLNATSGNLATLAGTGTQKDTNAWNPATDEGAEPTTVELSNPHMAMADAFGRIYVADKESHSVLRISADRTRIETVAGTHTAGNGADAEAPGTSVALSNPNGLYTLADGTTYILDLDNRKIRRLDAATGMLRTVLNDPAGFGAGRGLWVSPDESLIYYDGGFGAGGQNVQRWTPDNGIETAIALPGDLGNLTIDPGGHLVVTSRAQHQVYRVALDFSSFETIAGNGSAAAAVSGQPAINTGMERVRGIAFRPDGSYFLCSQKGGHVLFVDTAGIAHIYLTGTSSGNVNNGDGSPPNAPGATKIAEPRAISLAPNGDLIITTNDTGYIRLVPTLCPPSPPSEINIAHTAENITLTYPPTYRTPYIIEQSPDLTPDSWLPFTTTQTGTATLPTPASNTYLRLRAPR